MRINSAGSFNELCGVYKDILKKYNLKYEKYEKETVWNTKIILYNYYITINTLEELFNIMKELKQDLIINYEDNSITIYDDYVE